MTALFLEHLPTRVQSTHANYRRRLSSLLEYIFSVILVHLAFYYIQEN